MSTGRVDDKLKWIAMEVFADSGSVLVVEIQALVAAQACC